MPGQAGAITGKAALLIVTCNHSHNGVLRLLWALLLQVHDVAFAAAVEHEARMLQGIRHHMISPSSRRRQCSGRPARPSRQLTRHAGTPLITRSQWPRPSVG